MSTSSTVVSTLDEEMGLMSEKAPDPPSTFNALFHLGVPSIYRVWLEKSWMPELMEALSSFRGFQHHSVHVLSNEGDYVQYAIILQFDTVQVLNRWQSSEERGKLVKRLEHKKIKIFSVDHYGGLIAANTPNQDEENGGMEAIKTKFHLQDAMQFLPRPQPPPKWKLFIIIYVNVIFCILIEQIGGSTAKMIASGVPIGLAIFFAQFHSVPFMSYVTMPLCLSIPWVSYWLRLPRPRVEDLHPVLAVLEQGLQMFALQPTDVQLQARVRKLEERLDRLRSINNDLNHRVESLSERTTSIPHLQRAKSQAIVRHDAVDKALTARKDSPPSSTKSDGINPSQPLFTSSGPLTMVVRHYIKWEHVLDFNIWCDRIDEEMKK